jgi:hypothetical protein
MKVKINYNQLNKIDLDTKNLSENSAFSVFLADKIKRFYQNNAIRLNVMEEKMKELIVKYVLHDDNKKPVTKNDEKGILVYDFADEETRNSYLEEMNKFMSTVFEIEV